MTEIETAKCSVCGRVENIHLLDGHPGRNGRWAEVRCITCYGDTFGGWQPVSDEFLEQSVCPELKPLYDDWLEKWHQR
ncbi:hypothetical protein ACUN0C_18935 [Faunimonas sp. B44]|uniref:hypothetical protein n=1 Tax=Faunimonas sp. B44 TaxID=3461493 RepID=UPI004044FB3F